MPRTMPMVNRRTVLKVGILASAAAVIGLPARKAVLAATGQESDRKQLGFSYDQGKCVGCRACEKACKKEYQWEQGVQWRTVYTAESDGNEVFLSMSCNHCAQPACVAVCPVGAYTKRASDGIVVHDSSKCVGCKYCLYACPYHAPSLGEVTGAVSKCSMCYTRIDQGGKPVCVEACPKKALTYGDINELKKAPGATSQVNGLPSPELTRPSFTIIPKDKN